jgi:hypothetical protein
LEAVQRYLDSTKTNAMRKKAQRKVRGSARGAPGQTPDDGAMLRRVAVLVLAVDGAVEWGYALPMTLGGLLGG